MIDHPHEPVSYGDVINFIIKKKLSIYKTTYIETNICKFESGNIKIIISDVTLKLDKMMNLYNKISEIDIINKSHNEEFGKFMFELLKHCYKICTDSNIKLTILYNLIINTREHIDFITHSVPNNIEICDNKISNFNHFSD